ncbi:MAG TPA: glycosyltransferase family 2 protein, partial [bacterium]|nr:glycosyltransferase family 2 protein [bacterium]
LIQNFLNLGDQILNFLNSIYFVLLLFLLIVIYHILLLRLRDKKYIDILKKYKDQEEISINDLKDLPLVSVIVPAWKEGETFRNCLNFIDQLSYPRIKVFINAGGSKETLDIADSFKNNNKFTLLYQKEGEGKIKAINDCLDYIFEGIIFLVDADIYLNDEILIKMIYPIINQNEQVVISALRPPNSILNINLVKYLYINRCFQFRHKFSRYIYGVGSNACIKYEAIKKLGKFSEKKLSDDGAATGVDLASKGIKSFILINNKIQADTYPMNITEYFRQNLRWYENSLQYSIKSKKMRVIKFFGLFLVSIYLLIIPILLFLNISFFLIGLLFLLSIYLKKIRKIIFYKLNNKDESLKLGLAFFLYLIFYIYLDLLINIIVFFEMLFYRKAYKKRKNLLS